MNKALLFKGLALASVILLSATVLILALLAWDKARAQRRSAG